MYLSYFKFQRTKRFSASNFKYHYKLIKRADRNNLLSDKSALYTTINPDFLSENPDILEDICFELNDFDKRNKITIERNIYAFSPTRIVAALLDSDYFVFKFSENFQTVEMIFFPNFLFFIIFGEQIFDDGNFENFVHEYFKNELSNPVEV